MKKASEYKARADECRVLAARTSNPEHKAMLTKMAETWESLARERIERIARNERIAAIASRQTAFVTSYLR
jgi:hypothetical protein